MMKDWGTYCLMAAIIYIEEMSKPTEHIQIKKYKDRTYRCLCFHSIRLKMKEEAFVKRIFRITKEWERKKEISFIGKSFDKIRKENFSQQFMFFLSPIWINQILSECGKIPNAYSFKTAISRINNLKHYIKTPIDKNKNLFSLLLHDKNLAAGAFVVSMDLEFRGIQSGRPSLCMSSKYKDFLKFMLNVAQKWRWTNNKNLSDVNVEYSRKLGINASPQYEFKINIKGLQEIYELAGPLLDPLKDKCIKFNVNRSKNYINLGGKLKKNKTKEKIFKALKNNKDLTTTSLQFVAGVGTDVVLTHLHNLEKEGKVKKERNGKKYIWNVKCPSIQH